MRWQTVAVQNMGITSRLLLILQRYESNISNYKQVWGIEALLMATSDCHPLSHPAKMTDWGSHQCSILMVDGLPAAVKKRVQLLMALIHMRLLIERYTLQMQRLMNSQRNLLLQPVLYQHTSHICHWQEQEESKEGDRRGVYCYKEWSVCHANEKDW